MISVWICVAVVIASALIFGILGYFLGVAKRLKSFRKAFSRAFTNMDNYILLISLILLITSLVFSALNVGGTVSVIILNFFSSIIFSWLLTKKTSGKEFKQKEEELALRSYRHINYIESAANTASGTIDQYVVEHKDLAAETKLILLSAKEQIKYVQGGINTCKMDWLDLVSDEKSEDSESNKKRGQDYGTVDTVISNVDINQEDA